MDTLAAQAQALRAFNRFYTRRIGVLGAGLLETRFSLTESRLLWELAHNPGSSAGALACELGLDAGYLSRLLAGLRASGLVRARRVASDGRQWQLFLTAAGRRAFAPLDQRSQDEAQAMLVPLAQPQQQELLYATQRLRGLLSHEEPAAPQLRGLLGGELGWVVARHGALYAQEYGWNQHFEALVARIAADFVQQQDAAREAAWVCEWRGLPMGCVFLVQARDDVAEQPLPGVAQLRLLLVEPAARGRGIGKLLVAECERFAVAAGYRRIRLWTNSVLLAARAIYQAGGYRLLSSAAHRSFGHDLLGEVWQKELPA